MLDCATKGSLRMSEAVPWTVQVAVEVADSVIHTEQWQVATREDAVEQFERLLDRLEGRYTTPVCVRMGFVRQGRHIRE